MIKTEWIRCPICGSKTHLLKKSLLPHRDFLPYKYKSNIYIIKINSP